jgi:hypothetical protein
MFTLPRIAAGHLGDRKPSRLLQRLCVAGRCPDKAETSATLVAQPAAGLVPDQDGRHFQALAEPKINVIAGMAPMIGIQ